MKDYLGDSVYAELLPDGSTKLTTENGSGPSNTIIMEPDVIRAFGNFCERAAAALDKRRDELRQKVRTMEEDELRVRKDQGFYTP